MKDPAPESLDARLAKLRANSDLYADAAVFAAGWPLTMVGLELTHQAIAELLNVSQELSADPYLPGFRVAVAAIFDD